MKGTPNIRCRIKQRILEWKGGQFQLLTSSTILSAKAKMSCKRGQSNVKEYAKVFSSLVCRKKICSAIRYACKRNKGRVLMLGDIDEKSSDLVLDTLITKHSNGQDVDVKSLPAFKECSDLIDILVTIDNVEEVAKHLSGSVGLSGVDSTSFSH